MIEYRENTLGVTPDKLTEFCKGWRRPLSSEQHLNVLNKSDLIILAIDSDTGRVVGFITALTDHVQAAFISLLEVIPSYRQQGIGTQLMKRMLFRLETVPAIDLMCDANVQPFYAKLGMQPSVGMVIRNYG